MPLSKRLSAGLAISAIAGLMAAPGALASTNQVAIIQDNGALAANIPGALATMRASGATLVKVSVFWNQMAPSPQSTREPSGFNPADPNAYGGAFGFLDAVVRQAKTDGLQVGFMIQGPAPLWANGPGRQTTNGAWEPSGLQYQSFVNAIGKRYTGSFIPAGTSSPLPRVSWWSLWNEPNYGPDLNPQGINNNTILQGAISYRALVNGGYNGLRASGHTPGSDTVLIGELAPRGGSVGGQPGVSGGTRPLLFLDTLYCATPTGRRMTGAQARLNGCPTSPSTFKAQNPALFNASGLAIHPYTQGIYPTMPTYGCNPNTFCWNGHTSDPYYADFAELGRLGNTLDHLQGLYGGGHRFPLWNTEFGYWTNPPDHDHHAVSQTTAALYMNWAEYLSYRNPRIASYAQYQFRDPVSEVWPDGLVSSNGKPKLSLNAWEMPLFLPTTVVSRPSSLVVWGGARPAAFALSQYSQQAKVQIQFAPAGGSYATVKTVSVTNPRGYFQTTVSFTKSGTVRLLWTVNGTTLTSRTQAVTVR